MKNYSQNFSKITKKVVRKLSKNLVNLNDTFPLCPALPLPQGVSEKQLLEFLKSVRPADAPIKEIELYCQQDFRRFVYTYGLVKEASGECLELGSNPYFTTFLLREFTQLKLNLANYFGPESENKVVQKVLYQDFISQENSSVELESSHFNIEEERFPYTDDSFDVVLFCEIIEHLLMDPIAVLKEIKRVLKPGGTLVLTTPNVSRLENVARMIAGENIYDPYSGYGAYGRHNREYNKHELYQLLSYLGFKIDAIFTADVHHNNAGNYVNPLQLNKLVKHRENDLGQYIFVRALNIAEAGNKKPAFLYRSYPADELE